MDRSNDKHPFGDDAAHSSEDEQEIQRVPEHPRSSRFRQDATSVARDMWSLCGGSSHEEILSMAGLSNYPNLIDSIALESLDDVQDNGQFYGGGGSLQSQCHNPAYETPLEDSFEVQCQKGGRLSVLETHLEDPGHNTSQLGSRGSPPVFVGPMMSQPTPFITNGSSIRTADSGPPIIQNSRDSDQNNKNYPLPPSPDFSTQFQESPSLPFSSTWHFDGSMNNASYSAPPYPLARAGTSSGAETTTVTYHACASIYSGNSDIPPTGELPTDTFAFPVSGVFPLMGSGFSVGSPVKQQKRGDPRRPLGEHRGPRVCHLTEEEKKQRKKELGRIRARESNERENEKKSKAKEDLEIQERRKIDLTERRESLSRMLRKLRDLCVQCSLPVPHSSGHCECHSKGFFL
ncbi:uncharacterized protein LOC135226793 [Macrobrachium nipponense]|uniref:uncharacterized protein LOC135226793 n=1 Tax=Macrobrachium nipponense TaxID=159736 RepID=UPI0030C879DF